MAEYGNYTFVYKLVLTSAENPRPVGRGFSYFCRRLAAAAATAVVVAVVCCVVCAVVAAVIALVFAAVAVVILLDKQENKDEDQYPCAGIAAEKTSVAAHIVLPPFSDFTIYYADKGQRVKNQISGV